jgi:hypothetical protein
MTNSKILQEDGVPVTTVAGGGEGLTNPKKPIKPTGLFRRFLKMKKDRKATSIK